IDGSEITRTIEGEIDYSDKNTGQVSVLSDQQEASDPNFDETNTAKNVNEHRNPELPSSSSSQLETSVDDAIEIPIQIFRLEDRVKENTNALECSVQYSRHTKQPQITAKIIKDLEELFKESLQKDPLATSDTTPKLVILPSTLRRFLSKNGHLTEVDLSLPKRKLTDTSDTLNEETLAESVRKYNQNLITVLKENHVKCIVVGSRFIFLKDFNWDTLLIIVRLVDQLQCDLTVSGGGSCTYSINSVSQQLKIGRRITMEYERKFPNLNYVNGDELKVALVDSGCLETLYENVKKRGKVSMPDKMIQVVNPWNDIQGECEDYVEARTSNDNYLVEVSYADSLNHGTAVAEIITKFLPRHSSLIVASLGENILISNIVRVMLELKKRCVKIINCSFHVDSESKHLTNVLQELYEDGVVVVASAGNKVPGEEIHKSALHSEHTIVVGSHNDRNSISSFSAEGCNVDVCSLGENVFTRYPQPSARNGTSFATAYATTIVAYRMSNGLVKADEVLSYLNSHTSALDCTYCEDFGHQGHKVLQKIDLERLKKSIFMEISLKNCYQKSLPNTSDTSREETAQCVGVDHQYLIDRLKEKLMLELKKRGAKIINCSFYVDSESEHLKKVLQELYEDGIMEVSNGTMESLEIQFARGGVKDGCRLDQESRSKSNRKLPRIGPTINEEQEGLPGTCLVNDPLVTSDKCPKLIIRPSTLTRFLDSGHLADVELSLRKRKLPDTSETSLEESDEVDHQNLIDALNGKRMKFIVVHSRYIFLKDFDFITFMNLELLVDQLQCDLIVSGGRSCTYSSNTVSDKVEAAQRITMEYDSPFPKLNYVQGDELKVALMDTGCRESLYKKVNEQGRISMPDKMIQVVDPWNLSEEECEDYFDESTAASSDAKYLVEVPYEDSLDHGTPVAEILAKLLPQNSSLIVASLGENILISNVIRVMLELKKRDVKIINCSFHVDLESIHLANVLQKLYNEGVVVVASAGNREPDENIPKSALHTEHTIVVGGHNHINLISPLSLEACNVDVCCLGEISCNEILFEKLFCITKEIDQYIVDEYICFIW
ncbi:Minor extracellular protease Epr, partial [Pseudolycoriella hygida]